MPLDASRWTPKGETNGLNTLYIFKKHINLTLGILFCFLCAQRVKMVLLWFRDTQISLVWFSYVGQFFTLTKWCQMLTRDIKWCQMLTRDSHILTSGCQILPKFLPADVICLPMVIKFITANVTGLTSTRCWPRVHPPPTCLFFNAEGAPPIFSRCLPKVYPRGSTPLPVVYFLMLRVHPPFLADVWRRSTPPCLFSNATMEWGNENYALYEFALG